MELRSRILALRCAIIIGMNVAVCGNILDMTCVNFNPTFDPSQPASFAAILSGADMTSTLTFQRSIDLTSGSDVTSWCSYDDDVSSCQLPSGSNIQSYLTSSAKVTLPVDAGDNFGAYSCRAERYNWTTSATTLLMRSDANFTPDKLTVTASIDEEVRLVMNAGTGAGTGSLVWMLNGQTDLSASVQANQLNISRASKSMAGIHHYYYSNMPERGGFIRLIVRGCLDNLWGPICQYTCPTCYNGGICDDTSGRCVCPPGFMGDHCETACLSGYVGKKCSVSCTDMSSPSSDCQRALFCLPDPYGCHCAAGWSGLDCSTGCAAGTYGADCTQTCHCSASSNQCDPVTGSCDGQGGCDTGWYGPQCQVHIVDMTAFKLYAGIDDTANDLIGPYLMDDINHPSIEFYIGREVDTGPGETGHGVTAEGQNWRDSGLPEGTVITEFTKDNFDSVRATFDYQNGGAARAGAFKTAVSYKGRTEKVVMINEYRDDSSSQVWAEKLSNTVGVGETISLGVHMRSGLNQGDLVWRHNGDDVITAWRGRTSVTLNDVRKSDEGIYECYIDGNRETGKHAIMRLFVRDCPSKKYGLDCSNNCPDCNGAGVCHHVTGKCICQPGFKDDNCETACSGGIFGANCELKCNCAFGVTCDSATGCQGACAAGYSGDLCQEATGDCSEGYFGPLCNYPCHCKTSRTCDRISGQCTGDDSCADGWAGPDCQQALPRLVDSPWILDVTSDSVLIAWNAWKDGYDYGTGPVHSYLITYSWEDDVGNTGSSDEPVVVSEDSTANITDLRAFRDYEFVLSVRREVEGSPTGGISSSPITAMTPCGTPLYAPSELNVNVTGTDSILVSWQVPENPTSTWLQCESAAYYSYNLTYRPSENQAENTVIEFEGADSITHHVTGLSPCTDYIFSVVIVNSRDLLGPESQMSGTTDAIPPDPVDNLSTTTESYDIVDLFWTEPARKCFPVSYKVTRNLLLRDQCDDSKSDNPEVSTTNVTSYTYDDLYAYSTYNFTVIPYYEDYEDHKYQAIKASWTVFNSSDSVPTEKPGNLAVNNDTKQTLTYEWIIPSCKTRNGDVFYMCTFMKLQNDDTSTPPEENITTTTTLTYQSLPHYTSYNFTVCAYTSAGGGPCDSIQARTLPSAPTIPRDVGILSDSVNQTSATIMWQEPELINGILMKYTIQVNPGEPVEIADNLQESMSYQLVDLSPDTSYSFTVTAVSNGGESEPGDGEVTTLPIPIPGAPSQPEAFNISQTYIVVTWTAPSEPDLGIYEISAYELELSPADEDPIIIQISDGIQYEMTYNITDVVESTEYTIKVAAVNEGGRGPWSDSTTETTTAKSKSTNKVKVTPAIYRPILLSNLAKYVKKKRLSEGLEKEFKDLYNEIPEECVAFLPQNKKKNRYKNIVTFDEHRVKLKTESNQPGADYINATFFDGHRKKKAYIATQGPNTASLNDFWQMIYQQNVGAIVMLTNLVEDGKVKCLQYWPEADSSERYGDMFVTNKEEEKHAGFVHRRLELRFGDDEESRWVSQYHYTIWPDKREPECSQPLIDLRNIVRNAHPSDAGPLVVHCSAGVGRTGTFVTIDAMMSMIEQEKKVDIFNFVNNMRKRRSFMVQVEAQYEFIYETLLQWSVCPVMTCQLLDIAVVRPQWQKTDPASGKSEIAKQFELLDYITSDGTKLSSPAGLRSENMKKNRFADRMPADKSRPYLMMEGDYPGANQYINASFFDFEGKTNAHISTQCPLPSTITDFLRLVWDYDCRTVVHLNEMDKTCGQYWPSHGKDTYGSFTVELLKEHKDTDFMTKRVLNITSTKKKGAHRVDQFYYHGWPEDQPVPKSKGNFCQFILNVDEKNDSERPLLIVCIDGVGMSGTFLAAMATINKVKQDKTVDIFSAVKRLRKNRPGVVDSLERYEFCFDVVEAYKDSVQTYANFM
ncbi:receptor-type tyrosine-protein phosphatase F-like [Diadema antillarum]|uniref:receptor-type tyrosine-protein phosphatase F-like n=1 Tax=Diadema antillarum TaxID=105358 RepID=UPI003A874D7F